MHFIAARKKRTGPFALLREDTRLSVLFLLLIFMVCVIYAKLFDLQVLKFGAYYALATDQHEFFQKLFPERGQVYVQDRFLVNGASRENVYPVAINKKYMQVYAQPRYVVDPRGAAEALGPLLELSVEEVLARLDRPDDPYEPLKSKVEQSVADHIMSLNFAGIKVAPETHRYYPEQQVGAHVYGFVGVRDDARAGLYGVEGYFDSVLRGVQGTLLGETDRQGRMIGVIGSNTVRAQNGADIVLTIDKTIQSYLCQVLADRAKEVEAKSGAAIVLDPATGAVRAMCSYPDFNPNEYNKVANVSVYNNTAIFGAYEPGSVFKIFTMAAGLDTDAITPDMTYYDEGQVTVDDRTIRNASRQGYGVQTMTQVLEKSLNTGTVFAMRQMGAQVLRDYIRSFEFGKSTGIELQTESRGTLASLDNRGEIFAATASFGQGVTATPIQLAKATNAIANGGRLIDPYIVEEIRHANGEVTRHTPRTVKQVIKEKTATVLSGMMVSVIDRSRYARVPGYYIAGKTGTAQIADARGGYSEYRTNHTIVGFGPVERPAFTVVLKLEEPVHGAFAESTVGPLFARVMKFLVEYYKIPPSY